VPPRRGKRADAGPPRAPVLQHAYARSIHKSQGATADMMFLYGGAGLDARLAYVGMTRHREDVLLAVDAGAIRERLAEDGSAPAPGEAGPEQVRQAVLARAMQPGEGGNAADHVADKERWLRTGDPMAQAPQEATGWARTREAVRRAGERAIVVAREAVRRVARSAAPRPTAPPPPRQGRQKRDRGARMER